MKTNEVTKDKGSACLESSKLRGGLPLTYWQVVMFYTHALKWCIYNSCKPSECTWDKLTRHSLQLESNSENWMNDITLFDRLFLKQMKSYKLEVSTDHKYKFWIFISVSTGYIEYFLNQKVSWKHGFLPLFLYYFA